MKAKINNKIIVQRVSQYNLDFFVGIFTIKELLKFTRYTERILETFDEEGVPQYNGEVQRKLDRSRVKKITEFLIKDPDATFPTNLVLSIPNIAIKELNHLENRHFELIINEQVFEEIQKNRNSNEVDIYITIIDGQHRLKGIEEAIKILEDRIDSLQQVLKTSNSESLREKLVNYSTKLDSLLNIDLIVSFFVDPVIEFQAMIFSTINRTHKQVSQSLVYSLFGLSTKDSPQKSALEISLALNGVKESPFYNRIKLYGGSYERNQSPPLTQAMMVKSIFGLISGSVSKAESERYDNRRQFLEGINDDLIFRRLYANNEDQVIANIMFAYFKAIQELFINQDGHSYWDFRNETKPTNILQTTVGYQALLKILVEIFKKNFSATDKIEGKADKKEFYEEILKRITTVDFSDNDRYPFTSKSRTLLYLDMSLAIWPPNNHLTDSRVKQLNEILERN